MCGRTAWYVNVIFSNLRNTCVVCMVNLHLIGSEVSTGVAMKNVVFWACVAQ
jgi:hypothetical protein